MATGALTARWVAVVFVVLAWLFSASVALAAPPQQGTFARGAVVALRGTPHLWIVDEGGILHWSGDTRALSDKFVDWGNRQEVGLDQLRSMARGDPWLSADLLKLGDPIYFVKWESGQPVPTLLHIQSITDVELFGIDERNYGSFVLDQSAWERRFGMTVAFLPKGVLAPAAGSIPGTTRENPIPRGTAADLSDGWRLSVVSVTPNANDIVLRQNPFNPPPQPGHQFYIARVTVTRTGSTSAAFSGDIRLRAVGAAAVTYTTFDNRCGVYPDRLPGVEVFTGGTITGNVCWQIRASDADSLVLYDNAGFGTLNTSGRVYFALSN